MNNALAIAGAFALISSSAALAAAPAGISSNEAALDRYIAVAHEVCTHPADYGFSADGHADVGFSGKITKLVSKLFSVNISAVISGDVDYWKGTPREGYGTASAAASACAQNVFLGLLKLRAVDDSTHKSIVPPKMPAKYFAQASSEHNSVSSTSTTVTAIDTVGFSGVMSGGTLTVNVSGADLPDPSISNSDRISAIAISSKEGVQIGEQWLNNNNADFPTLFSTWYDKTDAYLIRAFDPSFSARFEAARVNSSSFYIGRTAEASSVHNMLQAKLDVLSSILAELHHR